MGGQNGSTFLCKMAIHVNFNLSTSNFCDHEEFVCACKSDFATINFIH